MKKYLYFYLDENADFHVVQVDSDCTPNAAIAARKIALPHDKRLARCVLAADDYSLSAVRDSLMIDRARIERCGRLPYELD